MKQIVLVAPHFPPSNLTGVHRSRFLASHLKEFGWEPIVLTVRPEFYEEKLDPDLGTLLPENLKIVRTKAFSTKPFRIVGDISIRCFLWHWMELRRWAKKKEIDFVFISLFPAYSTLLGRLIYGEFKIPYGIDYQDPWVDTRAVQRDLFSKAWFSQKFARWLEPVAVKKVSLLTGVSESYYEGVVNRNPHLAKTMKFAIPIGWDPSDNEAVSRACKKPYLFQAQKDVFNFVYAGALLPEAREVWNVFFQSLKRLEEKSPEIFKQVKVHCIGTGSSPTDPNAYALRPLAEFCGLFGRTVFEYPARIPYLDVLRHLNAADGVLVVGSTQWHYTASKIFQAVFSKKPILAILHEASTAVQFLKESHAAVPVSFRDAADLSNIHCAIVERIQEIIPQAFDPSKVDYSIFDPFTAESQAKRLAEALDKVAG